MDWNECDRTGGPLPGGSSGADTELQAGLMLRLRPELSRAEPSCESEQSTGRTGGGGFQSKRQEERVFRADTEENI